ncbi:MAG: alpha/beta hydrolase [Betaproteobacteria bacterium]|nr:alpha/beta hydrolase [Betaproteobacteria bacterium]
MSEAIVRGVPIHYEVIGEHGSWIALTPGSRRAYDELVPLARAIAARGHRVLLHDRRNCGRSGVAIEELGSEHEVWADDLHELGRQVGAQQMYVGGSSAGARLALLFTLRHPAASQGLLLWRVTGGSTATHELAETYYGAFSKLARAGGMAAVCDSEHFRACIAARPANREKLMAMKPQDFIGVMESWREKFLAAAELPVIGATEAELRAIRAPACIIAGNDRIHPPPTARKVASLIPGAEFHDDVVEKRPDDDLKPQWDAKEWQAAEPKMARIFGDFLECVDR